MARILPLEGKYYGTKVQYATPGHPNETHEIVIWGPNHFSRPFASPREIERGWRVEEEGHDHVESAQDYVVACLIADALSKAGF